MTSAPQSPDPESLVLRHLQALRREMAANNELLQTVLKHVARQDERLSRIEIDIAALEIKDASRHGELLQVLRKLAHVHEEGAGPGDFA